MDGVKIKICGLTLEADIGYVNEARPDYCGFIIHVPNSRRNTRPDQVRELRKNLRPGIIPVGVFVNEPVETVADLLSDHTIEAVQLHGKEDEAYIGRIRACGDFPVIKAFRVPSEGSQKEVANWVKEVEACPADLILLDQGSGGSGKTFDWSYAEKIRRPFFLAGGIGAENVTEALDKLHPWGVDMSSSVETDGKKDREKILSVVSKVRSWNKKHYKQKETGK